MTMINIASTSANSQLTAIQTQDVQPNAVDLRIRKILKITSNPFVISEADKQHRGSVSVEPDVDGFWTLEPGTYEVVMENNIKVGVGEAGFVITRSTLNRNGVFLTSGLYDSGYGGAMAAAMHVTTGPMKIQQGTRIGQYLCFAAEQLSSYNGSYGAGKEHDAKYQ